MREAQTKEKIARRERASKRERRRDFDFDLEIERAKRRSGERRDAGEGAQFLIFIFSFFSLFHFSTSARVCGSYPKGQIVALLFLLMLLILGEIGG